MNKPQKIKTEAYDYHECEEYITEKYGIDKKSYFWSWICDNIDVHNDSYFYLSMDNADNCNEWQLEKLKLFIKEFGEDDEIYFWVSW